jgi:membrane peptidoglycan carboxypeptidase
LAAAAFVRQSAVDLGVPAHLLELLLLIEDKRFPWHKGVDVVALVRAAKRNVTAWRFREGGSTLAQQLYNIEQVKAGREYKRNLRSKFAQIRYGLSITRKLTKTQVLAEYLGNVYWGFNYLGIDDATYGYFGKTKSELTVLESFFLAERLACPNRYSRARLANILRRQGIQFVLDKNGSSAELVLRFYVRRGLRT